MHVPTLCSSSSASTLTIWFSPDHKWNVSDRVVKEIGTLLSLARTLYASDYDSDSDSDSVNSENQPLWFAVLKRIAVCVPFISSLNRSGYLFEKLVSHSNSLSYMCRNIVILSKVWGYMYLFFYPFKRLELSFPKKYLVSIPKEFRCQSFALSICFLRSCPHKSGQFFKPHIFLSRFLWMGS